MRVYLHVRAYRGINHFASICEVYTHQFRTLYLRFHPRRSCETSTFGGIAILIASPPGPSGTSSGPGIYTGKTAAANI